MKSLFETEELRLFSRNIKLLRKNHGYTKKEMAQILGVSVYTLNKLEDACYPPRLKSSVLINIKTHFGISAQALFESKINTTHYKTPFFTLDRSHR